LQFDGDAVDTERSAGRTLILGGARSGKSTRAEAMADGHAEVTYIATGGRRDDDGEWLERVARHQARRPAHWRTLETVELPEALRAASAGSIVIIDCLALWLTAALDAIDAWRRIGAGTRTELVAVTHEASTAIDQLADAVAACRAEVVVVSNEVGMGIVPDSASGRLFRDLLGVANARIADACDDVVLVVAGRAIPLQKDGTHR
jgi:adenosylcobinamide kinase/adenosylcobinamide-phosphate guanylyltransferase